MHELGSARTMQRLARITARSAVILDDQVTALRGVSIPTSEKTTFDAFLRRLDRETLALHDLSRTALSRDEDEVGAAGARLQEATARADRFARRLAISECLSNDG